MMGSAPHTSPIPPGMYSNGVKAAIEVSTAKISGILICRVPRIAAASPDRPFLRSE